MGKQNGLEGSEPSFIDSAMDSAVAPDLPTAANQKLEDSDETLLEVTQAVEKYSGQIDQIAATTEHKGVDGAMVLEAIDTLADVIKANSELSLEQQKKLETKIKATRLVVLLAVIEENKSDVVELGRIMTLAKRLEREKKIDAVNLTQLGKVISDSERENAVRTARRYSEQIDQIMGSPQDSSNKLRALARLAEYIKDDSLHSLTGQTNWLLEKIESSVRSIRH